MQSLEQRIALMERRLYREREARKQAEKRLEDYSRQIFQSNQYLQKSLAETQKRQQELQFLEQASVVVASETPVGDLFDSTLEMTARFTGAKCAAVLQAIEGQWEDPEGTFLLLGQDEWVFGGQLALALSQNLPVDQVEELPAWLIEEVTISHESLAEETHWLVGINFTLSEAKTVWLVFLIDADLLDEEALRVLDTTQSQVRSGIRRRLSDSHVKSKNRELESAMGRLQQTQEQLILSEKMASLGQLSAGIAHEINNPIGFVGSNQSVLQEYILEIFDWINVLRQHVVEHEELDHTQLLGLFAIIDIDFLSEDINSLIQDNLNGLERVRDIVAALRNFSHGADVDFAEVDLVECLNMALKMSHNVIKERCDVDNQLPETLPVISGNSSQLQQVFVNLLVNAAQACVNWGQITLTATVDARQIRIAIRDNGCGMSETTKKQLFTPFFTTKPVGEGMGLGLSVIHTIVEGHQGIITVESEENHGSCFTVNLPLLG